MKDIIILAALVVFMVAVAWPFLAIATRRRNLVDACNIGEGTFAEKKTLTVNSAVTAGTHHFLVKLTSASAGSLCAANEIPVGTLADLQAGGHASGEQATVSLLGKGPTKLMVASEAITIGEEVFAAAAGKVQDLPGSSGTYYSVGFALTTAAADGDIIEVQDRVPVKVVIP